MPGVHIETLQSPVKYNAAQLDRACVIAFHLKRGRFVLCEPPRK